MWCLPNALSRLTLSTQSVTDVSSSPPFPLFRSVQGEKIKNLTVRTMMTLVVYYFLHTHRESLTLSNELPEESNQFRFLHPPSLANLKGSLGLIMTKVSAMTEIHGIVFM